MKCRRWNAKPFQLPPFPPYPKDRVRRTYVFQSVGLDYMGPVVVKADQQKVKRWICLFTCLSTRAVHLEVVEDLSSASFLHVLRRFISRRGKPQKMLSDNASQFGTVAAVIQEAALEDVGLDEKPDTGNILDYCSRQGIDWKFISPLAPWQGGIYERMIGLAKTAFRKAVGRHLLREKELETLVVEIEAILNSRPITYLEDESLEVIRPIDFLLPGAHLGTYRQVSTGDDQNYRDRKLTGRELLLEHWTQTNHLLDKFWNHWYADYLQSLRERTQSKHKQRRSLTRRRPRLGEIVLIFDSNNPRGIWKTGKIVEVFESDDKEIRSATVELESKHRLKRPVSNFLPLEVDR